MLREHGAFREISSDRPADETIHRGFVDAARQSPDIGLSIGRQGHAFPRPADTTLNFAAVACIERRWAVLRIRKSFE
jgi:hypothetical protein